MSSFKGVRRLLLGAGVRLPFSLTSNETFEPVKETSATAALCFFAAITGGALFSYAPFSTNIRLEPRSST